MKILNKQKEQDVPTPTAPKTRKLVGEGISYQSSYLNLIKSNGNKTSVTRANCVFMDSEFFCLTKTKVPGRTVGTERCSFDRCTLFVPKGPCCLSLYQNNFEIAYCRNYIALAHQGGVVAPPPRTSDTSTYL